MPIYEYRCGACGEDTEVFHRKMNEPAPVCPSCGEDALSQLVSRTSFKLKGGGWYVTDYKSGSGGGGNASAPSGGTESASEPSGSASTASESSSGDGGSDVSGGGSSDGGGSGGNGEAAA